MNVSRVAEYGYSNHTLHHSGRFENATINVQDNNLQSVANSATKVTISPEAQTLNETDRALSTDDKKPFDKIRNLFMFMKTWEHEIKAEAVKNGTSIKTAIKEHGMEIAKYFTENYNDPEAAKEFLEGITRYMGGQSCKDAFNLNDGNWVGSENDFLENKYDDLEDNLRVIRENYYKAKKHGIDVGAFYSFRSGSWVSPPDNNAIKPDEEVKEDAPQEKSSDKAAPQDKNEIFKDFAEHIIASHHRKKNKASYADFFEKMNHVQNSIKNPKIKSKDFKDSDAS